MPTKFVGFGIKLSLHHQDVARLCCITKYVQTENQFHNAFPGNMAENTPPYFQQKVTSLRAQLGQEVQPLKDGTHKPETVYTTPTTETRQQHWQDRANIK